MVIQRICRVAYLISLNLRLIQITLCKSASQWLTHRVLADGLFDASSQKELLIGACICLVVSV